jgi:hypothetical protein
MTPDVKEWEGEGVQKTVGVLQIYYENVFYMYSTHYCTVISGLGS